MESDNSKPSRFQNIIKRLNDNAPAYQILATLFGSLIPIVGVLFAYCSVTNQIEAQRENQQEEYNKEYQLERDKFESELLLKALERPDDSLFKKLVSSGFLDDSKKRYSFLLYDTVYVYKPRSIGFTYKGALDCKYVGGWDSGHVKPLYDCAEGTNFQVKICRDGALVFTFDIEATCFLSSLTPTLIFKPSWNTREQVCRVVLPTITVPNTNPTKKRTVVFKTYDENIRKNYERINFTESDWE